MVALCEDHIVILQIRISILQYGLYLRDCRLRCDLEVVLAAHVGIVAAEHGPVQFRLVFLDCVQDPLQIIGRTPLLSLLIIGSEEQRRLQFRRFFRLFRFFRDKILPWCFRGFDGCVSLGNFSFCRSFIRFLFRQQTDG